MYEDDDLDASYYDRAYEEDYEDYEDYEEDRLLAQQELEDFEQADEYFGTSLLIMGAVGTVASFLNFIGY